MVLQNERGEPIKQLIDPAGGTFDYAGDLDRIVLAGEGRVLRYVDPYGDLVLNHLQVDELLMDVADIADRDLEDAERRGLERLRIIAEACRDGIHLYVRFIGD
jgi:hypothetical protein